MFNTNVKLKKATWQRVKKCSEAAGYSSPEEFVEHILRCVSVLAQLPQLN